MLSNLQIIFFSKNYIFAKSILTKSAIILPILLITFSLFSSSLEISIQNKNHEKVKLLLAVIAENQSTKANQELNEIADIASNCIKKSKQFDVKIEKINKLKTKDEITNLFDKGYYLVIFLENTESNNAIDWRVYDTKFAKMIKGKKLYKRGTLIRGFAYNLADEIWNALTMRDSCFSTKIAYIKRMKDNYSRNIATINVSDFDGSNSCSIKKLTGTYVGLYWNNNINNPNIFVSEFTPYNVRIVSFNLKGSKKNILDIDGTCAGISVSNDNKTALYCKSGQIWHYFFDEKTQKSFHKCLIKNDGKNTSPILLPNNDMIFCSDSLDLYNKIDKTKKAKKNVPKIYYYHKNADKNEILTNEGYCVSPSYCQNLNKIVYSKRINGIMQLFTYDLNEKKHEQITFDNGNKTDSSFSPCGSYIIFSYSINSTNRIAIMHTSSKERWFITKLDEFCISPAWSKSFVTYPAI